MVFYSNNYRYEDRKRVFSNEVENEQEYFTYDDSNFIPKKCKSIRVGNIVKIYENQFIPADIILLYSSNVQSKNIQLFHAIKIYLFINR